MPPPAEGFASRLFLGPALRTQPDRRLVTLVREGYETAFEEIVRRYGRPLTRYAASIVGGRSDDVTQDAFSKALLALRRDEAQIELRPWLFRIVRNAALNDLRDSPPSPELLAEAIAGGENPAEELERREELADLIKRLQALPEPQRAAIVMRELEGLGHEEIAAALGLTGGGARQAIYRARQALRDGAGMLVPLPLLQAMLAGGGSEMAETAGAAGMSAAGAGGAAGAGIALKATAATVLVAGAVGAGVAIKDNPRSGAAEAAPARVSQSGESQATISPDVAQGASASQGGTGGAGEDRHGHGSGEAEPGDDHGSHREVEPGDGGEPKLVDDHGGHGGGAELGDDGGHRGSSARHSDSSGPGGDERSGSSGSSDGGSGSEDSSSRHAGDSGSGHDSGLGGSSGSGSSGSGDSSGSGGGSSGGGSGSGDEPAVEDDSGSGSGSGDGSGSDGGSGSSGGGDSGTSSDTAPEISP
jgi:RNA polymerase sigma factor (sigma-70 family)